jgi:hypothetical protein
MIRLFTTAAALISLQGALQITNDSGQTPAEILRQSPESFVDRYSKGGTIGGAAKMRQGYYLWAQCRERENLRIIGKLPAQLQRPLRAIAQGLRDAVMAEVQMQEALAGGGTMYLDFRAGAAAEAAQETAAVLRMKPAGTADRLRVTRRFDALRRSLNRVPKPTPSETEQELLKSYDEGHARLAASLASLETACRSLPEMQAARVTEFLASRIARIRKEPNPHAQR